MVNAKLKDNCYKLMNLTLAFQNCQSKAITGAELAKQMSKINEDCEKEREELNKFFDALSDDEVIELLAVMYGGRDYSLSREKPERDENNYDEYDDSEQEEKNIVTWEEHFTFYKSSNSREGAEDSLRSKAPLIQYIKNGMSYFSI